MSPWPVLKSCKHNGLIFRGVKMFQSKDWPLRPVGPPRNPGPRPLPLPGPSPRATQAPQGAEATRRGPPHPSLVFPERRWCPSSVPGQPLASGSAWDPSPGAKHQTRLLLQTKPRRTPSLCLDPRALLLPPLRPSAPRRAPPAIPSSPQAAPSCDPSLGEAPTASPAGSTAVVSPGLGPSHHRSPQRLLLPQQPPTPPPSSWPRGPGAALTGRGTCAPAA